MAFKKGKSGNEKTVFKDGETGNPNGKPKKLVSKVLDELKLEGELVSKSQISEIYMIMLSLTMERLTEIANDKKMFSSVSTNCQSNSIQKRF